MSDSDAWSDWARKRAITTGNLAAARSEAIAATQLGYVLPRYLDDAERWHRARHRLGYRHSALTGCAAHFVLFALAHEIDDRRATLTGETVCAECGGRGERIVLLDVGRFINPAFIAAVRRLPGAVIRETPAEHGRWRARFVVQPCPCDGRRRPVTVFLRRCVDGLARTVSPWPALWLVNTDAMDANGWRDAVLPSGEHVPAWMCRWWRAFRQSELGREPVDVGPLFDDLAGLLPDLEMRADRRMLERGLMTADEIRRYAGGHDDRVDALDPAVAYVARGDRP